MLARNAMPLPHTIRRSFKPDFVVETVADIDFGYLKKHGIKAILIDLDGTVVPHGTYDVPKKISKHLHDQHLKIYIATNRPKSRSLENLETTLNASGVVHPHKWYGKPLPQYYKRAAQDHNLKVSEVAMIGDRYLQDIYGANAAGIATIAVRKLDKPANRLDALLSRFEERHTNKLMRTYQEASH
jgi:HAD superfamily phosphatase (TIGR01668 family)